MSHKLNVNLLVTCVGGDLGPELLLQIKQSKNYNYKIIGVDSNIDVNAKYFCDKFYLVPPGKKKKLFIEKIIQIIKLEKINYIIPSADEEAIALSFYKKEVEEIGCKVISDDFDTIKLVSNKLKTYNFLNKYGINKCFFKPVKNYKEVLFHLKENKYNKSWVLKPSNQRGSRNIFYINKKKIHSHGMDGISEADLKNTFKKLKKSTPFILMEKLNKPVFDVDILSWKGKLLKTVQRKRIFSDDPNKGHELVNQKKIYDFCKNIVKIFNLSWLYDFDIMFNKLNEPCLLEINPRKSGSLIISLMAKIHLIDDVINLSQGRPPTKIKIFEKKIFIPFKSMYKVK